MSIILKLLLNFLIFENVNEIIITDGFKVEYNLKINVTKNLSNNLIGKPIKIQIGLNASYFDRFPGESSD